MEKILKKLNLFNWLMLLIFFIGIILPIYTTIMFGGHDITVFSMIILNFTSFVIVGSVFVCLLLRLCTCKVKKEYSRRNKQIILCLIPLLFILFGIIFSIIGFSTSGPDGSERDLNLLNGNYDIYVILSLVSIAIPIMYDFVLLGCTFAFTKPLKQEHKSMIKEKRKIKHDLKVEQKEKIRAEKEKIRAEKEKIYQEKLEAKTKAEEEKRLHKESLCLAKSEEKEKLAESNRLKAIEKEKNKENLLNQKIENKNNKIKERSLRDEQYLSNFNKNFYHSALCILQKVLVGIYLIVLPVFGIMFFAETSYDYFFEALWVGILFIVSLTVIVISFISLIVVTILQNVRKIKLYHFYLENRDDLEKTIDEKTRYRMAKEYIDVNGLYYTNKKRTKIHLAYKTTTYIYGILFFVSSFLIVYVLKQANMDYFETTLLLFGVFVLLAILLIVYFILCVKRIVNIKLYSEMKKARIVNSNIEQDFDERYMEYIQNEKTGVLLKRATKLGNARSIFKYLFSSLSDAILIGIPLIVIEVIVFVILLIVRLCLIFLESLTEHSFSSTSSSSNASSRNEENDDRLYKTCPFDLEGECRLDDENTPQYLIGGSGTEYRIFNYHRNTGYFEDENGNIYYHQNNKFIKTGLFRKHGESEYEADERARKVL